MAERWFTDEELHEMTRPTMERAIEALDKGDIEEARVLCQSMTTEWRYIHDMLIELVLGLVDFVKRRFGEDEVAGAWRESMERAWREDAGKISKVDRRAIVEALAASWRAHSTSGTGPHPGRFTIEEDDEKVTFVLHPCGSGQRLVLMGKYDDPERGYSVTEHAHDWSFDRANMPLYCTHCTFMNELLPMEWSGLPLYPLDPPVDYHRDPCRWYWYKDPADIPDRFWARYGLSKPDVGTAVAPVEISSKPHPPG